MSRGKAEFLRSLKEGVSQRRKLRADFHLALHYLMRWEKGLGENADLEDLGWFKRFWDIFCGLIDSDKSNCDKQIEDLFADCGLSLTDPDDHKLLVGALAQTIYPRPSGAKQKWDAAYYDDLWRDIRSIENELPEKRDRNADGNELPATEIATILVGSPNYRKKYQSKKRGFEKEVSAGSLRKRVAAAKDPSLDHNPNLHLFDFDYIVRGVPGEGPACAAALPFEPALPQGSAAAKRAALLENQLFADAQAFFEALGLFMTEHSKWGCRRAARRMARRSVRLSLETNKDPTC